jgi:cell division septation protein DedD
MFVLTLQLPPAVSRPRITVFGLGEVHAAEVSQPALVRKKLPALVPAAAPSAESLPAPTAPATEASATEPDKPKEAAAPEPALPPPAPPPESAPAPSPAEALPAKMEAPKPAPQPITVSRAAYPFSILLSSCKERENALGALSGYRQAGLAPYIVQTDLGSKGVWWRTLTGHYRSLAEATQAKTVLKLPNAVVVKTPYANLIGQYGSEAEAAEAAARVTPKDVFPYLVKGPGASFQLMAGAFSSQQAADMHRRELDARGVSTRTVQR